MQGCYSNSSSYVTDCDLEGVFYTYINAKATFPAIIMFFKPTLEVCR